MAAVEHEPLIRVLDRSLLFPPTKSDEDAPVSPCTVPRCQGKAKWGKPYCIAHMDRLPLVRAALAQQRALAEEIAAVNRQRRLRARSLLEREVVAWLLEADFGAEPVRERDLELRCEHLSVSVRVLAILVRRGVVVREEGAKGHLFYRLSMPAQ